DPRPIARCSAKPPSQRGLLLQINYLVNRTVEDGPCPAGARGPGSRISRGALAGRADRRVVVARRWPCDHDGVERRALARATVTAAHRLTWREALLLDGELLLADHLGPFAGLRLDVIGELFR